MWQNIGSKTERWKVNPRESCSQSQQLLLKAVLALTAEVRALKSHSTTTFPVPEGETVECHFQGTPRMPFYNLFFCLAGKPGGMVSRRCESYAIRSRHQTDAAARGRDRLSAPMTVKRGRSRMSDTAWMRWRMLINAHDYEVHVH
jgi:hypothetical protein